MMLFVTFAGTGISQQNQTREAESVTQNVPVSYGILVDNSGSIRMLLERVVVLAKDVVEENQPDDEAFLVRFISSDKISLEQDLTAAKGPIHDAADGMYIEGGQTALIDAVAFSAKHLAEKSTPDRLRALVLISDGDERGSVSKLADVQKLLKESNIRVFVIGLGEGRVETKILEKFTKETGGKIWLPKTVADISTAVKELAVAMRTR